MGSSELGPIYRRTGDPRVDGLGITIELSGAATHRADQAASHHGRAVGGASTSRNRRFESVPLQQTVRLSQDFSFLYRKAGSCRGVRGPGQAARPAPLATPSPTAVQAAANITLRGARATRDVRDASEIPGSRAAVLEVRIHLPPADSPSLAASSTPR